MYTYKVNEQADVQGGNGGYIWSSRIGCVGGKDINARIGCVGGKEISARIGCVGGK
jgi:hypothetical protein